MNKIYFVDKADKCSECITISQSFKLADAKWDNKQKIVSFPIVVCIYFRLSSIETINYWRTNNIMGAKYKMYKT